MHVIRVHLQVMLVERRSLCTNGTDTHDIRVLTYANITLYTNNNQLSLSVESHNVTDFKLTEVSDLDIDKEIEKDLSLCTDMYMSDNATSMLYPTFKNRLNILQEYIPRNYSTKFKNPCWLDFYQIPSSPLMEMHDCHFPKFNDTAQAGQFLQQVKTSGTRHMYCLPAFFVPGFPKCATTTLFRMLIKHPQVARPSCKESYFWSEFVSQSGRQLEKRIYPLWYLEVFSQAKQTIESNPQSIALDATPMYTHSLGENFCVVPILLKRMLPEAKFILIMRNPTKRYISHYWVNTVVNLKKTYEKRSKLLQNVHSEEAIEAFHNHTVDVIMQFQLCVDENSVFHCIINPDNKHSLFLQHSLYYYHIAPWLKVIPHERFLFLRTEDLVHDSSLTMSKVWHFLDVHDLLTTATMSYNVNRAVKHLKIPSQTKQLLDKFYQPYNQLLAHLLADTRYLWNDYY